MIKHYGYTTDEMIAWCRICRPGSVVGPQQQFCADYEHKLLQQGEAFKRKAKGVLGRGERGGGMRVEVTPEKPGLGMSGSPEKDAMRGVGYNGKNSRQVATSPIKNRTRARPRTGGGSGVAGGRAGTGSMPAVSGVHTSRSSRNVNGGGVGSGRVSGGVTISRPKSSGGIGAGRSRTGGAGGTGEGGGTGGGGVARSYRR